MMKKLVLLAANSYQHGFRRFGIHILWFSKKIRISFGLIELMKFDNLQIFWKFYIFYKCFSFLYFSWVIGMLWPLQSPGIPFNSIRNQNYGYSTNLSTMHMGIIKYQIPLLRISELDVVKKRQYVKEEKSHKYYGS